MVRSRSLLLSGALLLATLAGATAQDAAQQSGQQVCQAKADALNMPDELRSTYLRECLAGEELVRDTKPGK